MTKQINWGNSGEIVYNRTYSRTKPDGSKETWPETVNRVVKGNLSLVYGHHWSWDESVWGEFEELVEHMLDFRILPAGRHLWASGVKGRQYLMNCWTAGWGTKLSEHFEFTFLRLMEGGGVGSNYSSHYLAPYALPRRYLRVHIVCDPEHPDYQDMLDAGVLSTDYSHEWDGAFIVPDSREGWADALTDLVDTYMTDNEVKHEHRVYDVTNVRGKGARLKTFGGTASGPLPFARMMSSVSTVLNEAGLVSNAEHLTPMEAMEIDHAIAECVVSGGNRRSARMAMVRWDDPYVFDFIQCKADQASHWTTNISVEIDDEFLDQLSWSVESDRISSLDGTVVRHVERPNLAQRVHNAVTAGMLDNGEPGYWNNSLSNVGEVEPVYCTNPCGEITLQPWEACNLGHVNLDAFAPATTGASFNMGGLIRAHELVTRFLMRATYADINDPKSRHIQDRNRRIGVGHFGVQGFIVKNGWRYSEIAQGKLYSEWFTQLLSNLSSVVRGSARAYAFELRIPEPIKVTTVAPTGSIAKLPGVGEGIHVIYSRFFERRIRFSRSDPDQVATVAQAKADGFAVELDVYDASGMTDVVVYPTKDPLVAEVEAMGLPASIVESADELNLDTMLGFQALYQRFYADNAVSFTCNVKPGLDKKEAADTIAKWLPKLKGTTVMVDDSREQSPYTRMTAEQYEATQAKTVEDSIDLECATGACPIR